MTTVVPRIVVTDAAGLVAFIQRVFHATGDFIPDRPTWLQLGDSAIMVSEPGARETMTAFLYVYVPDSDATYRDAVDAGAQTIEEPFNTPYGDRRAMVLDAWGNTWQIATHRFRRDRECETPR